jgi:hypothetical protein
MPDLQARLIEAAVRPLASDAEIMQSGKGLLASLTAIPARGAEDALKRWNASDAKAGKTAWRLFFYFIVTVVLVVSLTSDSSEFQRYQRILRGSSSGYFPQDRFDRTYSAAEKRLLLIGAPDISTSLRAKALWDSDPDNAAYFANYAVSYLADTAELPAGFLETARRLDPENSFFSYLAAASEVLPVRTTMLTARGGKVVTAPYDHVLSLFHEAAKLPRFDSYLVQLRRERIPLLPQGTIFEYMDSANFLAHSYSPNIDFGRLQDAIQSNSSWFSASADNEEFIKLNQDIDAFLRKMTHGPLDLNENSIVTGTRLSVVLEDLERSAARLELDAEATELQSKADRLKQWNIDRHASTYQIDGKDWPTKAGILKSRFIWIKQAVHPPVLTDHDIKPGRMFDHGVFAQICSYTVAAVLGLMAMAVALFRFRSPPLVRRLSARMEVLLHPVDWLWLLAAGIPSLPYLMLIAHLTNLGGYGTGFSEMPINLPYGGHANLPMAQFAGVLLMMLILPILVARWRLGIRAAAFGFANTRLWLGSLALLSAVAFIPVVGWAVIAESKAGLVAAWLLLALPVAWLCGVACRAMISGTAWLLHHTTASRVLVPAYVAGLLYLLLTMSFFKWSRQYWFERDSLSHLDPAYPAFSKFEYDLSAAARKELREALGYEQ